MQVDLHIHTTYSDGIDSPEKIVSLAKSAGLGAIAITDHDTLDGVIPAVTAGLQQHLEVIPGIELGSEYGGEEIHILGYLIKLNHKEFLEKLSLFRKTRIDRMKKMIQKLRNLGFEIELDRVFKISGSGSLGRPHLATALLETGAVKSTAEAFDLYIGAGRPAYVPRYKLTPTEAIQLIRSAGSPGSGTPGIESFPGPTRGTEGSRTCRPGSLSSCSQPGKDCLLCQVGRGKRPDRNRRIRLPRPGAPDRMQAGFKYRTLQHCG